MLLDKKNNTDKNNLIKNAFDLPAPKKKFLVGNIIDFASDPLLFLTKCAHDYGDIIPIRFFGKPVIFLNKPEYIDQTLKDRETFGKPQVLKDLYTLLGNGLLTSEGDSWFRQRRLAQPVFHQKRIATYGNIMVAYTEKMLENWVDGEIRDIQADMMRLTLNIVMKSLFSQDPTEEEAADITNAMHIAAQWMLSRNKSTFNLPETFPTPSNLRYRSAVAQMDKHIYHKISQRRSSGENFDDLLSMMMGARDEDDGSQMSDKQLRDEISTLIFAGHETSANALAWTFMLLCQNPKIQTQLRQEIQEVLGIQQDSTHRSPTVTDIPALKYTNLVIKESMRLYPVVWSAVSETSKECQIGEYQIPAGCTVMTSQWVMHRWEKYFDQAEAFKPERWQDDLEKKLPPGVYFPFGGGARSCIGKSFALMESVLLLATIIQKYEISLVPNQSIIPEPTITLQPLNGIKIIVKANS
jgi:cytochrome P450